MSVGPTAPSPAVKVFISYAHDSPDHREAVRHLWLLLRSCGIDARIDLIAAEQPQDWALWMSEQLRAADYVLVIASPSYRRRAEGTEQPGRGSGAQWEAALIRDAFLSDRRDARRRFLPVLLPGGSTTDIPEFFGRTAGTHYRVDSFSPTGIERLVRFLTGQPLETEPPLGRVPILLSRPQLSLTEFVPRLAMFGRYQFDVHGTGVGRGIDPNEATSILPDLYSISESNQSDFAAALAETAIPVGGWTVYGAYLMTWELNLDADSPATQSLVTAGLQFLRDNGVPPLRLAERDWDHWLRAGGTLESWLPRIPTPTERAAPISPLRWRETRRIAQLMAEADSNIVFVRREGHESAYSALIDSRSSYEDARRTRRDWKRAESLYELYVSIGLALQVPPHWCDPELLPYFPLPRPAI